MTEPSNTALMSVNASERNERLLVWARNHGEEFRGGQAADALGVKVQGIGPVLAAMVRKGELKMNYHGSTRMYAGGEVVEEGGDDSVDGGELSNEEIGGIVSLNIVDKLKEDFEERQANIVDAEIPEAEQEVERATQALANLREELATVERTLKTLN